MLPRLCQFSGRSIERVGGEERLPPRDPPVIIGLGRREAFVGFHCLASQIATPDPGLSAEHGCRVGQQGLGRLSSLTRALEDLREQSRGEGQLVAFAGQGE
jgi:hypothetical protein